MSTTTPVGHKSSVDPSVFRTGRASQTPPPPPADSLEDGAPSCGGALCNFFINCVARFLRFIKSCCCCCFSTPKTEVDVEGVLAPIRKDIELWKEKAPTGARAVGIVKHYDVLGAQAAFILKLVETVGDDWEDLINNYFSYVEKEIPTLTGKVDLAIAFFTQDESTPDQYKCKITYRTLALPGFGEPREGIIDTYFETKHPIQIDHNTALSDEISWDDVVPPVEAESEPEAELEE